MFCHVDEFNGSTINLERSSSCKVISFKSHSWRGIKLKLCLAGGQLNMVFLTVLESEVEEELEFIEIAREEDTVISLTNGSNMYIAGGDETKISILRDISTIYG